jgi:hypothetical protein
VAVCKEVEYQVLEGETWPLLDSARGHLHGIAVASLVGSVEEISEALRRLGHTWLVEHEAPRQPKTRITDYYGLFGHTPLGRNAPGSIVWEMPDERHAGLAPVPDSLLAPSVEYICSRNASGLLITARDAVPALTANDIERSFVSQQERFDWGQLLCAVLPLDCLLVRVLRAESSGMDAQVIGTADQVALIADG